MRWKVSNYDLKVIITTKSQHYDLKVIIINYEISGNCDNSMSNVDVWLVS